MKPARPTPACIGPHQGFSLQSREDSPDPRLLVIMKPRDSQDGTVFPHRPAAPAKRQPMRIPANAASSTTCKDREAYSP